MTPPESDTPRLTEFGRKVTRAVARSLLTDDEQRASLLHEIEQAKRLLPIGYCVIPEQTLRDAIKYMQNVLWNRGAGHPTVMAMKDALAAAPSATNEEGKDGE